VTARVWLLAVFALAAVIAGAEAGIAALGQFAGWQWVMVIAGVSPVVASGGSMLIMTHFDRRMERAAGLRRQP